MKGKVILNFFRHIIVVFSLENEKRKKAALLFRDSLRKSIKDTTIRRTEIEIAINRARDNGDKDELKRAEQEKAMLQEMVVAGVPIVAYPHAVSMVEPSWGSPEWESKDLSKHFRSAVATFTLGRLDSAEVFGAYFSYHGKLLAYCFRIADENYHGDKVIVPDLTETCEIFPFITKPKELKVLWQTSDIMQLAKRVGDELGIDIHNEYMAEFLDKKCILIEDLGLGKSYSYLG